MFGIKKYVFFKLSQNQFNSVKIVSEEFFSFLQYVSTPPHFFAKTKLLFIIEILREWQIQFSCYSRHLQITQGRICFVQI